MKKKIILFFLILFTTICFSGCSKEDDTKTEVNTIEVNRTSTDISNLNLNDISNNTINNNIVSTNQANNTSNSSNSKVSNKSEELLAQFSTRIYSTDSARQNNLEITSKKLNGTVVKPNETFSFTKTIGPSTAAKGYEEADIYDSNGNKIKGYGGGNCQVSSTLYNAVQKVSSLEVVERHEHSNTVPYVKEGHDAAVAYGSVDFKFKNTNNFSIKILVETSKKYVVVKLMKI
jgi:vancomycin resistance protein YoaR